MTDLNKYKLDKPKVNPQYSVNVDGIKIDVPVAYNKASAVMVFIPISTKKLVENLNIGHGAAKPVQFMPGKCLLAFTIFDYLESPVGPYKELAISIPVNIGKNIPVLPLLFDNVFKSFGFYNIKLLMNTRLAIKHSRDIFGYNTYDNCIQINHTDSSEDLNINISEGEKALMHISMKKPKKYNPILNKKYNTFFSKNNELRKVEMTVDAYLANCYKSGDCQISFGEHDEVAILKKVLATLKPIQYSHYISATEVLSAPIII